MGRHLASLLQRRLREGRSPRPSRGTRESASTRRVVERLLDEAERALHLRNPRGLVETETRFGLVVRDAIPVRSVRRTLEPATRMEVRRSLPGRRSAEAEAFRVSLECAESHVPDDLWPTYAVPTVDPGGVVRAARACGIPVVETPFAVRLLARRVGVRMVHLRLPPYRMFEVAAAGVLGVGAGRLLSVGGFALLPRRRRDSTEGFLTLQACRARLGVTDASFPERGGGTTVAVVDTGIDLRHPAFAEARADGRLRYRRIRGYGSDDDRDVDGHGTHVHGIACGGPSDPTHAGLAPGASQFAVRVFEPGSPWTSNAEIIEGLTLAVNAGADIVNMSLGGPASADSELGWICGQVVDRGVALIVAAAGNSAGERPEDGVECPGNASGVVGVAAIDPTERIAWFSSRGRSGSSDERLSKPDMAAYGIGVVAPRAGTSAYVAMSGTSMASPMAAGYAACVLGRLRAEGRRDDVGSLRAALLDRCSREDLVGPGGAPFPMQGWNRWVGAGVPRG